MIPLTIQPPTIRKWHRVALEKLPDEPFLDRIGPLLAEGCVFESPVVHTPQVGKAITTKYLQSALDVLNTEHFRYGGEWYGPPSQGEGGSAVLEFFTVIDGITINGIDIIEWDEAGLITRFKVMVRPLKAINTLHAKMAARLGAGV